MLKLAVKLPCRSIRDEQGTASLVKKFLVIPGSSDGGH